MKRWVRIKLENAIIGTHLVEAALTSDDKIANNRKEWLFGFASRSGADAYPFIAKELNENDGWCEFDYGSACDDAPGTPRIWRSNIRSRTVRDGEYATIEIQDGTQHACRMTVIQLTG